MFEEETKQFNARLEGNMKEYRTEVYRLYPDKAQKDAICKKFDLADSGFNKLAMVVNALASNGNDRTKLETAISEYPLASLLDETEAHSVRNTVKKLIPKLVSGEISAILPRNRYRNTKTLEVMASPAPAAQVMIDGVGVVRLAFHRPLPDNARVFRVTLKSDCCGERFYLMYSYYFEHAGVAPHPINPDLVLGIDYKQDGLYVDSDGNSGGYPGFRQKGREKLCRYRENTKHFQKGSHRWKKHQSRLAKYEQHIENQRADWQYKKAEELAESCDAVCRETLDFKSMIQADPRLAAKIYDNDLLTFSRRLSQKMEQQGKRVIQISRYFPSSQICSYCGNNFGPHALDEHSFCCPYCGAWIDRDVNAARNIKEEGLRLMQAA